MDLIIKRAVIGGVVSTVIMGSGTYILGKVSGYEARQLLTTSLEGIHMLCNTVIIGSSTILALMLTLLSLSRAAKSKLTHRHYEHVHIVAKTDTFLIITAVITFLLFNLPITESEHLPASWFTTIYYFSLIMAAILGGGFIALIAMLYGTIDNVIKIVGFKQTDHPLVDHNDEEDSNSGSETDKKRENK